MAARTLKKRTAGRAMQSGPRTEDNSVKTKKRVRKSLDYTFLVWVVIMLCFGLVMVLSASAPAAISKTGNAYHFFTKQLVLGVVGVAAMLILSMIDYRVWKKWTNIFIVGCVILLVAVLIPGIGSYYNGAWRWIPLGGIQIQPSEFTKLAVAMHFAAMIENTKGKLASLKDLIPYGIWLGVIAVLMLMEPHLSGTMVICGIGAVVLIVGGLHPAWITGGCVLGVAGVSAVIATSANKMARFLNFLDPFADAQNMGWQVVQSLYAIGSGGLFGLGLGQSRQKYTYLPEPYNDFIFSVICEELGLLGAIIVIVLFVGFVIRGTKIAMEAPDTFGSLMVTGIVAQVAIQAILNIAVATSSVPNTGISLPFFSYGGTAIVILMAEMGLILSVSRYSRKSDAK